MDKEIGGLEATVENSLFSSAHFPVDQSQTRNYPQKIDFQQTELLLNDYRV